jgi:hypothetical protein
LNTLGLVFSWIVIGVLGDLTVMKKYKILSSSDKVNNTSSNATNPNERDDRSNTSAVLFHFKTEGTEINRTDSMKVWRYDLKFAVCGGTQQNSTWNNVEPGEPVYDRIFINDTLLAMKSALRTKDGLPSLNTTAFLAASNGTLKLSFPEDSMNESAPITQATSGSIVESLTVGGKIYPVDKTNQWVRCFQHILSCECFSNSYF